ncbi:glycosyltransferase family 39 protein, partial [Candidatus Woesearchaeota archaeon]|nr:glycosyltransferase family 39 protein [Candidatus Woesearchaeota archaeon]
MNPLTIIFFFMLFYCLGHSLLRVLKCEIKNRYERFFMRIGFGLSVFPILAVVMNTTRIPLLWYIFLVLSLIIPVYDIKRLKDIKFQAFRITKSDLCLLVLLIIFAVHLFVFIKGSYAYPYLEDGDPMFHSEVAQYIAYKKSYTLSLEDYIPGNEIHYTEPYPPAYGVLNGIMYQIDKDTQGILRIFNSLIISLGIIFFYYFLKRALKSSGKALFGAFILAAIPSYLSHFIFATGYSVTLFFPALYALIKIDEDDKWLFVSGIAISGVYLTQPTSAGIFFVFSG